MHRLIWRYQQKFTFGTLYKWEMWVHRTLLPNFLPFIPFLFTHASPPHPPSSWEQTLATRQGRQSPTGPPKSPCDSSHWINGRHHHSSGAGPRPLCEEGPGPQRMLRRPAGPTTLSAQLSRNGHFLLPGFRFFLSVPSPGLLGALCKHCCSKWLNSLDI